MREPYLEALLVYAIIFVLLLVAGACIHEMVKIAASIVREERRARARRWWL